MTEKKGPRENRQADWWRRIPGWVSFAAAMLGVVGGLIVVVNSAISVADWADETFDWRDDEYAKLASLRAGFDIRYFEDQLGHPVFTRQSSRGDYLESTFRGRDFWVQAISQKGEVDVYAVTACDPSFNPSFEIPSFPYGIPIVLGKTSLASSGVDSASYEYLLGANTYHFFDAIYGALPGHYKTYLWGLSSTCDGGEALRSMRPFSMDRWDIRGDVLDLPKSAKKFRREATVNTFAETAPAVTLFDSKGARGSYFSMDLSEFHGFQIGPSTVLWRSVAPDPFPEER